MDASAAACATASAAASAAAGAAAAASGVFAGSAFADEAPPPAMTARIQALVRVHAAGAIEAHDLRIRQAGPASFLEFHLVVPGAMSVAAAHDICDGHRDFATASLIEVWIDETERRAWFLFETAGRPDSRGH